MKIPIIEQSGAQTRGYDSQQAVLTQPNQEVAQAVGQSGQAVGQTVDEYRRREEEAKRKADALVVTDGLTQATGAQNQLLHGTDDADGKHSPGFLETQGLDASAKSQATLESYGKRLSKISEGMANDEQRTVFKQHATQMYLDAQRTVEIHSSQQFKVAQKQSLVGLEAETEKAVANSTDDLATPSRIAAVEKSIRDFGGAPEYVEAQVSAFKAKIAVTQINRNLGAGDIAGAEKLLEEKGDDLGTLRDNMQYQIDLKRRAGHLQREQTENEATVSDIITKSLQSDSTVDKSAALRLLEKVPPERFTEVAKLLATRERYYDQARAQTKTGMQAAARQQWFDGGHSVAGLKPDVKEWLKTNDGDYLVKLERDERTANRRAKAGTGGAKQQREADRIALWQYRAALIDDPETDALAWSTGRGVGPVMTAELQTLQVQAKQKAGKAASVAERQDDSARRNFVNEVQKIVPELKREKGKKSAAWGPDEMGALRGQALEAYDALKAANPDKRPTPKDVSDTAMRLRDADVAGSVANLKKQEVAIPGTGYDVPLIGKVFEKKESGIQAAKRGAASDALKPAGAIVVPKDAKPKLAPGRYKAKDGRFVIVDEAGNKRFE